MTATAAPSTLPALASDPRISLAPRSSPPTLAVERVCRVFGADEVLSEVSLDVAPGEVHALLGPNGAGKTTLLRVVGGLMDASSGRVRILGREHRKHGRALRQQIGIVPSGSRSFYLRISAFENLVFFGRMYGLSRREAARRADEVLADVGLSDAKHARVQTMSTGMQRRLATARALLPEPTLILIDEATHDLDPHNAHQVRDLVRSIVDSRGAAVLWATQRVEEIRGFADDVTVLRRGEVRFSGAVTEFLRHAKPGSFVVRLFARTGAPTLASVHSALGTTGEAWQAETGSDQFLIRPAEGRVLGDALAALISAGLEVISCNEEHPGAEQAFLQLTSDS